MTDREKVIGHFRDAIEASGNNNKWRFVRVDIIEEAIDLLNEQKSEWLEDSDPGQEYKDCDSTCEIAAYVVNAPTVGGWISVKDRLPVETHSIFYRFYGTQKWSNAMWREQSDKVLVTVAFKDGTKIVTTGETHDGVWNTTISRTLEPVVTHWQAMPEPPKEE